MRSNEPTVTRVRPRGLWLLTSRSKRARLHLVDHVNAEWHEDRTVFFGRARCGAGSRKIRLYLDPPDRHELCDECAVADFMVHVVYRFYGSDERPLYIGYTSCLYDRIGQHKRTAAWWSLVASWRFEEFPDQVTALAAERAAVRDEQPIHNVRLKEAV